MWRSCRCFAFVFFVIVASPVNAKKQLYNLPSKPIHSALGMLAEQAKVQILYNPNEIQAEIMSQGVYGPMTAKEAVEKLLKGTGLQPYFLNDAALVVKAKNKKAQTLQKEPQSYLEEVVGYGIKHKLRNGIESDTTIGSVFPLPRLLNSNSVSSLDAVFIKNSSRINTASLIRNIPGFIADFSGGEASNSNVSVRGLPFGAGTRYVQLQEDGFPILHLGDIAFASSDSFFRYDQSVNKVEAIRGGSATTLLSNAAGGAINFISKTGSDKTSEVLFGRYLERDHYRTEFSLGGNVNQNWYGHISGFYRSGEGNKKNVLNINRGKQVKANITRRLDNGYMRFYLKYLNDKANSLLLLPTLNEGKAIKGFDAFHYQSPGGVVANNPRLTGTGHIERTTSRPSLSQDNRFLGTELAHNWGKEWKFIGRFGFSDISANHTLFFPETVEAAVNIVEGSQFLQYANGNQQGQEFDLLSANSNGLAYRFFTADVEFESLDMLTADLRLTRQYENSHISGGLYLAEQEVSQSTYANSYLTELKNQQPALLNIVNDRGEPLTYDGAIDYGTFANQYDEQYRFIAPYINLLWHNQAISLDVGLRLDYGKATGKQRLFDRLPLDINGDGYISVSEKSVAVFNNQTLDIEYDWLYPSYSIGANIVLSGSNALFSRFSQGEKTDATNPFFSPSEATYRHRSSNLKQLEIGYRFSNESLSFTSTLFELDLDGGLFNINGNETEVLKSRGFEVEASAQIYCCAFYADIVWLDSRINNNRSSLVFGNQPQRLPEFTYNFTGMFHYKTMFLELNLFGVNSRYADNENRIKVPSFNQLNGSINYSLSDQIELSLSVTNILNKRVIAERAPLMNQIIAPGSAADGLGTTFARFNPQRSLFLGVKYSL